MIFNMENNSNKYQTIEGFKTSLKDNNNNFINKIN